MSDLRFKAESVLQNGDSDDWLPESGFCTEMDDTGSSRLVVSAAPSDLRLAHAALVRALGSRVGVLYRLRVDRLAPEPQGSGAPPRDFVALDLAPDALMTALVDAADLIYGDARCELWLRGTQGEQVILDHDGLMFVYPDSTAFRDALATAGLPEKEVTTMADRDYVKHWFHADCDAVESALFEALNLTEVPRRG